MKTPLAILNLVHQPMQTLISVVGVGFALLLVFMQLGFMGAVSSTATNVFDQLNFDIVLRSPSYVQLYEAGTVSRKWEAYIEGFEETRGVTPFWITVQKWRSLPTRVSVAAPSNDPSTAVHRHAFGPDQSDVQDQPDAQYLPIAVMTTELDPDPRASPVWKLPKLQRQFARRVVANSRAILVDDSTQADYGPLDGKSFGEQDMGREPEIGGRTFEIRGLYQLGTGLAANGAVVMSRAGLQSVFPLDMQQQASLLLVQVSGDTPEDVQRHQSSLIQKLRDAARLPSDSSPGNEEPQAETSWLQSLVGLFDEPAPPSDIGSVTILAREEAIQWEIDRWLWETPIGIIFQLGVLISLLVGGAIVYMILSTDVSNRLPEYATLLAIGYSRRYLASIVMTQAMVLSGLGFVAAWIGAEILYRLTSTFSGIPLTMLASRVVLVGCLGVFMCCVSGLLALRKLWKAEPASLF